MTFSSKKTNKPALRQNGRVAIVYYYLQGEEATPRLGPADDRKVLSRVMVETRQDQQ